MLGSTLSTPAHRTTPRARAQEHALESLDEIVDMFWTEISESISKMCASFLPSFPPADGQRESLLFSLSHPQRPRCFRPACSLSAPPPPARSEAMYDDEDFGNRNLAALVTSKVYFHLGEHEDALEYALNAGPMFDVWARKEYQETIAAKCIDKYIEIKAAESDAEMSGTSVPDDSNSALREPSVFAQLEGIVENMFERCYQDKEFKQALGIALESRRLDKLEECVQRADNPHDILNYCYLVAQDLVTSGQFRKLVLRKLVDLYGGFASPDYVNICQCLMFLDDSEGVAEILNKLVRGGEDDVALAYQIGFDLVDNEQQAFMANVSKLCAPPAPPAPPADAAAAAPEGEAAAEAAAEPEPPAAETAPADDIDDALKEKLENMSGILSGKLPVRLFLEFLYSQNKADPLIAKNIKAAVAGNGRKWRPVEHSATIVAYAYMQAGTTVNAWLRDNQQWLQRANHWSRFTATAAIGVINQGHLEDGFNLLSSAGFLPSGTPGPDYAGGGALYALGLTYVNHGKHTTPAHPGGQDTITYLRNQLQSTAGRPEEMECLMHGACLGVGLAAINSHDNEIWTQLNDIMQSSDNAVAGEAAGLSMGLVMAGSMDDMALQSMLQYAHDTDHEKIVRGLAIGIALLVYGCEERADTLIRQLADDKDHLLRYGGMYAIGMAYCGTANNSAMKILLHVAVSDMSDDVRRAAVMALGFVLFRVPHQAPRVVSLLAASYNPHLRYGAAMAVGIACAGTGQASALELLEPLWADSVDFVRQGAFMGTAMVLIQHNETQTPLVKKFREQLEKYTKDPHDEVLSRFGAILAAGMLDAGGRNVTISLRSRSGHKRMSAIIGMAVFTQSWYWHPLLHFLSLSFTPTTMIALNSELKMPKLDVKSDVKPSLFAYTANLVEEKKKKNGPITKAVLSTAGKKAAKLAKKDGDGDVSAAMEVESPAADSEKKEGEEEEEEKKEEEKEEEKAFEMLTNPARVTADQEKHVVWEDARYRPITPVREEAPPAALLALP